MENKGIRLAAAVTLLVLLIPISQKWWNFINSFNEEEKSTPEDQLAEEYKSYYENCPLKFIYNPDKTAEIIKDDSYATLSTIKIPPKVIHDSITYTITKIEDNAFHDCMKLTSVTIPNTIKTIGTEAFDNCWGLKKISIPQSVTTIGDNAFRACSGLTEVTIPSNVTNLGMQVFAYCDGLKKVTINTPTTGQKTFYHCHNLETIELSSYTTEIGYESFALCPNLLSLNIPSSVTNIGERAFANSFFPHHEKKKVVVIPSSVTNIGEGAFQACISLNIVIKTNGKNTRFNDPFIFSLCGTITYQ